MLDAASQEGLLAVLEHTHLACHLHSTTVLQDTIQSSKQRRYQGNNADIYTYQIGTEELPAPLRPWASTSLSLPPAFNLPDMPTRNTDDPSHCIAPPSEPSHLLLVTNVVDVPASSHHGLSEANGRGARSRSKATHLDLGS